MRAVRPSRRFGWRLYGVVRPVVRPIAWRLRGFLVGAMQDDLRAVRAELAALRAELAARDDQAASALDARIAAVLEQALLTMALDREARSGEERSGEP